MRTRAWAILVGLLMLLVAAQTVRANAYRSERDDLTTRWDSAQAEWAVDSLEMIGVSAQLGVEVDDLERRLSDSGEEGDRVQNLLDNANVRIETLTNATASAGGGAVVSRATIDTVFFGDSVPASWSGEVEEDLLDIDWTFFRLPDPRLFLRTWSVDIPVELTTSIAGDGRTLVTGRSTHENATLTIDSVFVDPTEPVEVQRGLPLWVTITIGIGGYLLGR